MDYFSVAGLDDRGPQPGIGGDRRLDRDVAVIENAAGGDLLWFGEFDNEIGFAEGPIFCRRRRVCSQGVFSIAARGALFEPPLKFLRLFWCQAATVDKSAIVRIGVPGRHPLLEQNLLDGVCAAFDLFIARHSKGPDVSWAMAGDAAFLQI